MIAKIEHPKSPNLGTETPRANLPIQAPGPDSKAFVLVEPLFRDHRCHICEDTGLVSTSARNSEGQYLSGRCWAGCAASHSVVWDDAAAQFVAPAGSSQAVQLHE